MKILKYGFMLFFILGYTPDMSSAATLVDDAIEDVEGWVEEGRANERRLHRRPASRTDMQLVPFQGTVAGDNALEVFFDGSLGAVQGSAAATTVAGSGQQRMVTRELIAMLQSLPEEELVRLTRNAVIIPKIKDLRALQRVFGQEPQLSGYQSPAEIEHIFTGAIDFAGAIADSFCDVFMKSLMFADRAIAKEYLTLLEHRLIPAIENVLMQRRDELEQDRRQELSDRLRQTEQHHVLNAGALQKAIADQKRLTFKFYALELLAVTGTVSIAGYIGMVLRHGYGGKGQLTAFGFINVVAMAKIILIAQDLVALEREIPVLGDRFRDSDTRAKNLKLWTQKPSMLNDREGELFAASVGRIRITVRDEINRLAHEEAAAMREELERLESATPHGTHVPKGAQSPKEGARPVNVGAVARKAVGYFLTGLGHLRR